MSKIAIYGDAHITKRMGKFQDVWEESAIKVFTRLYSQFEEESVKYAICLGDFFDKAVLEAKSVRFVLKILSIINNSAFPTYFLLGNHEMYSESLNILEYLSEYENIIPITGLDSFDNLTFIPYSVDIETIPSELIDNHYVFTHHDIYGSELASGKLKASFGIDPNIFSRATAVFNGHIHLHSILGNIINVGSILKSQQGELKTGESPVYYYLDTQHEHLSQQNLRDDFIAYQTISALDIDSLLNSYNPSVKLVLRVEYIGDNMEVPDISKYQENPRILKISLRKLLVNKEESEINDIRKTSLDMKEFLSNYIKKDDSVAESEKVSMINLGLSLLGECIC